MHMPLCRVGHIVSAQKMAVILIITIFSPSQAGNTGQVCRERNQSYLETPCLYRCINTQYICLYILRDVYLNALMCIYAIKLILHLLLLFLFGFFFFSVFLFILFWALLGLHCCTRAFSGCGKQTSHCGGFSCCRAQALGHRVSGVACSGSAVAAHRLSCLTACGIFLNQGSNSCPLHWQADS